MQCGLSTATMQSLATYSSNGPRKNKENENRKKWIINGVFYSYVKKHELKCTMLRLCPLKHRSDWVYLSDEHGRKVLRPSPYAMFFFQKWKNTVFPFLFFSLILHPDCSSPLPPVSPPNLPSPPYSPPTPPKISRDINQIQHHKLQ